MEKKIIIAPVGPYMQDLFVGIREFPTERVVLIAAPDQAKEAEKTRRELEKFKVPCKVIEIKGNVWEETFRQVAEIKRMEGDDKRILVNVSTGDRETRCAATSAAFVNGIKAFGVADNDIWMLPILKFSYYKQLTDKKLSILKVLYSNKDCCSSLEELSKKTHMSLPLLSYHINGNLKSEGLKELGVVDTTETKGKVTVTLTVMGRLLVKGYV